MAQTYELTTSRRAFNWLMARMLGLGLPVGSTYMLTVPGRKTGKPYSTPVTLAVREGTRYLVAPYGEVSWVKNARAAGEVKLSRGRTYQIVPLTELSPEEAAPILKQYVTEVPVVRPFFDAAPDSSIEHFKAEAPRKPVFRLE